MIEQSSLPVATRLLGLFLSLRSLTRAACAIRVSIRFTVRISVRLVTVRFDRSAACGRTVAVLVIRDIESGSLENQPCPSTDQPFCPFSAFLTLLRAVVTHRVKQIKLVSAFCTAICIGWHPAISLLPNRLDNRPLGIESNSRA